MSGHCWVDAESLQGESKGIVWGCLSLSSGAGQVSCFPRERILPSLAPGFCALHLFKALPFGSFHPCWVLAHWLLRSLFTW